MSLAEELIDKQIGLTEEHRLAPEVKKSIEIFGNIGETLNSMVEDCEFDTQEDAKRFKDWVGRFHTLTDEMKSWPESMYR